MIEWITSYIQPIILQYGALGVFLATIIEEVIAPIPSPLVSLSAGFFLLPVGESFLIVIWQALYLIALPVAIGITLGSLAVYGIGYWGGKPMIEKCKKWLGFSWRDVETAEQKLISGKGDEITLFTLRVLPIVPGAAISGFCGVVRYPLKTFVIITFLGAFVRAVALGVAGWYAGVMYMVYVDVITKIEKYILLFVIAITLLFMVRYFWRKKQVNNK